MTDNEKSFGDMVYDYLFLEKYDSIEIPFNERGYRKLKIENLTHLSENEVQYWLALHSREVISWDELLLIPPFPFDEKPTKEQLKRLEQFIIQEVEHYIPDVDITVYILPLITHLSIDGPGYLVYPRIYLKLKVENERHGKIYYRKVKAKNKKNVD